MDTVAPQASAPFYIRAELTPASGFHSSYRLTVTTFYSNQLAAAPASLVALVLHVPLDEHVFVDPFQVAEWARALLELWGTRFGGSLVRSDQDGSQLCFCGNMGRGRVFGKQGQDGGGALPYALPAALANGYESIPVNFVSAHILVNGSNSMSNRP